MSIEAIQADLAPRIGQEIHVSEWLLVSQAQIDAFAAATGDHQWIHTNVARAAEESPWRTTIAHGYLTLSLHPVLRGNGDPSRTPFPGVRAVINYGLNRLRFMSAVRAGARIRGRYKLLALDTFVGGLQLTEEFTVEIEGARKPACVAEVLTRLY